MAREGWLAKVHSEQFHLPKVSEVGPGGTMLLIAEREKHTRVNAILSCYKQVIENIFKEKILQKIAS